MVLTLSFVADAYGTGTRHPMHEHDSLHMSIVLCGRLSERVGSSIEYAGALSVVAKDAGVAHANEFGIGGARIARLGLEEGSIAKLIDDSARSSEWRWTHDAIVAAPFLRLVGRGSRGITGFASDDPDVLDLLAAFTARPAAHPRGTPPAWLGQTLAELRESWRPGMSVSDIAARAGVHPVYLARSLRRWFGTGVGEELRRLRFKSAAAAVAGGTGAISSVAHSTGYADEAHLCRDFRRAVGTTPGRYRALLRGLSFHDGSAS